MSYVRDSHFLKSVEMYKQVESILSPCFPSGDRRVYNEKLKDIEKSNVLSKKEIDILFKIVEVNHFFGTQQSFDCSTEYLDNLSNALNLVKDSISNKLNDHVFAETSNTPIASSNGEIIDVTPSGSKAYDFKTSARMDDEVKRMKNAGKGKEFLNSIIAIVLTVALIVGVGAALAYKYEFGTDFSAEKDAEKLSTAHSILWWRMYGIKEDR